MKTLSSHLARVVCSLLTVLGAASLHGQTVVCSTSTFVPPVVRSTGTAELMGDVVFACTGGVAGQQTPISVSISLNTAITSRTLAGGAQTEALLVVENNGAASQMFNSGRSGNALVWNNVSIPAPGPSGSTILRFTNIRADATAFPVSVPLVPGQIFAFASMSGVTLTTPQQVVAFVFPDMRFGVRDCAAITNLEAGGAAVGCGGSNNAGATSNLITGDAGMMQYSVTFQEGYQSAFRKQVETGQINAAPGAFFHSESGYIPSVAYETGLANHGTRLHARFTNLPAGVRLFVTNRESLGTTSGAAAVLVQVNGTYVPEQLAPRVPNPLPATHTLYCPTNPQAGYGAVEVPITNGSGEAVWEVTGSLGQSTELFAFGVAVAHGGIPAFNEAVVEGFLGPAFAEAVPRFKTALNNVQKTSAFSAASLSPKVLPVGKTTLVTIRVFDASCMSTLTSIGLQAGLTAGTITAVNSTTWIVPITVAANAAQGDTPALVVSPSGISTVTLTVGPPVFTISGRVTRQGAALSEVTVGLGNGGTRITDSSGNYAFTNLTSGAYLVTPFLDGHLFEPAQVTILSLQADTVIDFAARPFSQNMLSAPHAPSPANFGTTDGANPNLTWSAAFGAESYDVYFGTVPTPPFVANVVGVSFRAPALASGTIYYWRVVAKNSDGANSSPTWSFRVQSEPAGLGFHIMTPCRVMDTRGLAGPASFGGPALAAYDTRTVGVPYSSCGLPPWAQAYSLNMTAVPASRLDFLSTWPAGQSFPNVSTLNSPGGLIMANAAIVPAGSNGAVDVLASNPSDLIIDVNGYFSSSSAGELIYYPVTPCRAVDTRASQGKSGAFGPPALTAMVNRDFPIPSSGCNVPSAARAFAVNMTVVPQGPLGYLSMWPSGQTYPGVSTLNASDGSIVANAAIVPAGVNGAVTVFGSANTELIMDVNGYFAPQGTAPGGLRFYPVTPCRAVDTRPGQSTSGAFGPPALARDIPRDIPLRQTCSLPNVAQAYSLNITAVPNGALPYLSAWPTGQPFPNVSTLNSPNGRNIANAAIIPAGIDGSIRVMAAGTTDLIIDINGYFAP